jgi:hypothetical protein
MEEKQAARSLLSHSPTAVAFPITSIPLTSTLATRQVVDIEEEWGDWLVTQKQMDAAINHFIESAATLKAIKAALDCRQFNKAAGIIEVLVSGGRRRRRRSCGDDVRMMYVRMMYVRMMYVRTYVWGWSLHSD